MEVRQVERYKKVQTGSWLHEGKAGRERYKDADR